MHHLGVLYAVSMVERLKSNSMENELRESYLFSPCYIHFLMTFTILGVTSAGASAGIGTVAAAATEGKCYVGLFVLFLCLILTLDACSNCPYHIL